VGHPIGVPAVPRIRLGLCAALELLGLVALAWWGFDVGAGVLGKLMLGVGVPVAAAALYASFVVPRQPVEISAALRLIVQGGVYAGAAVALAAIVAPGVGTAYAASAAFALALTARRVA